MAYHVYSFADTRVVLVHPNAGESVLSEGSLGKLSLVYAGEMSTHTATAGGYVVINRMKTTNGVLTLEVPQNSNADRFLRYWLRYVDSITDPDRYVATSITITDNAGKFSITLEGVTPQKRPDRSYDQTSSTVSYNLLAVTITEKNS